MEGPLSKWTNMVHGWQYRWFRLEEDALLYYTSREKMLKGQQRGCMRLHGAVVGIDGENNSLFTITVDGKVFHLQSLGAKPNSCLKYIKDNFNGFDKFIAFKALNSTSVSDPLNSVSRCPAEIMLYNFGETVSIVMWLDGWEPDSYYDKIAVNMENGFHTLCLLDIKTKEQSIQNMIKGRKIYEPPRYLSCAEAATQLLKIAERKKEAGIEPAYNESSPCVGLARIGWEDQKIVFSTLKEMSEYDLGPPLHSLILPGHMHPMEVDMLNTFKISS